MFHSFEAKMALHDVTRLPFSHKFPTDFVQIIMEYTKMMCNKVPTASLTSPSPDVTVFYIRPS